MHAPSPPNCPIICFKKNLSKAGGYISSANGSGSPQVEVDIHNSSSQGQVYALKERINPFRVGLVSLERHNINWKGTNCLRWRWWVSPCPHLLDLHEPVVTGLAPVRCIFLI